MSELDVKFYFAFQFIWFLIAWSVIAFLFIEPKLKEKDVYRRLSFWVAPHLFRVFGVGLLVQNLSPNMPKDFALSTAIGDSITAFLAFISLFALYKKWQFAFALVWIFNVFGFLDGIYAGIGGFRAEAHGFLHTQWYVPVFVGPLMIVSHVLVFKHLLFGKENK